MSKTVQTLIIAFIVGVLGFSSVATLLDKGKPQPLIITASSSGPLDEKINTAIGSLPLKDKEQFYKVYKGLGDYCDNVKRIREIHTVGQLVGEVYLTYKMEGFTQLDTLLVEKMTEKGFDNKALFMDKKNELRDIFNEIASGIKYSIEKNKEVK